MTAAALFAEFLAWVDCAYAAFAAWEATPESLADDLLGEIAYAAKWERTAALCRLRAALAAEGFASVAEWHAATHRLVPSPRDAAGPF